MIAAFALLLSATFAETKALALQIHLDRAGFSCSAIDGVWGRKADRALSWYVCSRGQNTATVFAKHKFASPDKAFDALFSNAADPFRIEVVTQADLDALVKIPESPAERAKLSRMGYESIKEMFAERGHLSQIALAKMNPGVDWNNVKPGLKLVIPDFPPMSDELKAFEKGRNAKQSRAVAAEIRVSISQQEIRAYDAGGRIVGLFPCSIAANKAKIPPHGELRITNYIAWPNFTYTPDFSPRGTKAQRYVWPPGENCPVGVAWMGLNLPGYGIHGTPRPESIGFTGSHGCFRLANWNAARLFAMSRHGTRVIIEP